MELLDQITRFLGDPRVLWSLKRGSRTVAAIARWRHQGAVIDLSGADAYQVIFNLTGGQVVELPELTGVRRKIRAGSVGINSPEGAGVIRVHGQADTLQILLSPDLIPTAKRVLRSPNLLARTQTLKLQPVAAQALVALEGSTGSPHQSELELIVLQTAKCLVPSLLSLDQMSQGGLSPGARRRVCSVFQERLTHPAKPAPRVKELANVAGLSLFHFIRAHYRSEGQTPYARVLAERVSCALELLLRTKAPISWISDTTSFSSPSHFVSTFRRHMGVTPGAFRHAAWR